MRQDSDEWLEEKIDEDLMAWADAEERRIMEDEELQNVTMPEEKLEDIRREIRRRRPQNQSVRQDPPPDADRCGCSNGPSARHGNRRQYEETVHTCDYAERTRG